MSSNFNISNFLDSRDEREKAPSKLTVVQRPWKEFWPPQKDSELWNWLATETPDVLTWQFKVAEPFIRPWHKWTQVAALKGAACSSFAPQNRVIGYDAGRAEENIKEQSHQIQSMEDLPLPSRTTSKSKIVHDMIADLSLSCVQPNSFTYLSPSEIYTREKPYYSRLPFLNSLKRTNVVGKSYQGVQIFDVSKREEFFRLDESGFEYVKAPVSTDAWTDAFVREEYLPQMAQWLESRFSCKKAHIYAYNFRSSEGKPTNTEPWIKPFTRAHCDVTSNSSVSRLQLHLSLDSPDRSKYQLVAMWRPISEGPFDYPLAVCDFRTIDAKDLVETDIVFPHYCDESYEVKYNPSHRWFFKSDMSLDEAILFSLYNPNPDHAEFCVHSAFENSDSQGPKVPRRSVELRAILER